MKKTIMPPLGKKDPLLEKFHFFFIWAARISFLVVLIIAISGGNWGNVALIVFAILLTYLAVTIEKRYAIDIPIEFEISVVVLIFGAIFLGEIQEFYKVFWWWDLILHGFTGLMVGLLGFIILLVLYKGKRINAAPITIALFSFSLAAAIGGVWEIFEFIMDQTFGLNMQKSGLMDTMWDIIVNNVGALVTSVIGYIYLRVGEAPVVSNIVRRFKKDNPKIVNVFDKHTKRTG